MSSVTCPFCKGIYKNQYSLRNHCYRMHEGKKTYRVYLDERLWDIYKKAVNQNSREIRKLYDEILMLKKYIGQLQKSHGRKTILQVEQ